MPQPRDAREERVGRRRALGEAEQPQRAQVAQSMQRRVREVVSREDEGLQLRRVHEPILKDRLLDDRAPLCDRHHRHELSLHVGGKTRMRRRRDVNRSRPRRRLDANRRTRLITEGGDLANWTTGKGIPAVGGAMDLVVSAKNVFVMSQHTTKDGSPKFLKNCSLPLTGKSVVTRVYSNLAVLDVTPEGFKLKEMCEQIDFDLLQKVTEAKLISI